LRWLGNGKKTPALSRGRGIPQTGIPSPVEDMPRKPIDRISRFFFATLVANEQTHPLAYGVRQGTGMEIPALALDLALGFLWHFTEYDMLGFRYPIA
jgi:hypothetical protein